MLINTHCYRCSLGTLGFLPDSVSELLSQTQLASECSSLIIVALCLLVALQAAPDGDVLDCIMKVAKHVRK